MENRGDKQVGRSKLGKQRVIAFHYSYRYIKRTSVTVLLTAVIAVTPASKQTLQQRVTPVVLF